MTDKRIKLRDVGDVGKISMANAEGLRPVKKLAPLQVGLGQDRMAGASRRVLMCGGLRGGDRWAAGSGDVETLIGGEAGTKISVAGPLTFTLNPGCILALHVVYWPAGDHAALGGHLAV